MMRISIICGSTIESLNKQMVPLACADDNIFEFCDLQSSNTLHSNFDLHSHKKSVDLGLVRLSRAAAGLTSMGLRNDMY
jgi:hypothetical protein